MSLTVDPSAPWRLSHILDGHRSDVKSVCATSIDDQVELIHSASRDETARSWFRNKDEGLGSFQRGSSYQGKRFQNAVAHFKDGPSGSGSGTTLMGGLDARILSYETKATYSDKPQSKAIATIQDHYDNVCHLSVVKGETQTLLISASWDCTSRVWKWVESEQSWSHLHTLKGHERAVWAAEVVSAKEGGEVYLTASADLFVRLWHGEELKRVFSGHEDVVRAIALLPPQQQELNSNSTEAEPETLPRFYDGEELFVTASNDGSLRVWSLDDRRCPPHIPTSGGEALRVLRCRENSDLLYDVKYAGMLKDGLDRVVISCGEDGVLRGWNIEDGSMVLSVPQPVSSVWSLAILPHSRDIATANSDGHVRIFTQRPATPAGQIRQGSVGEVTPEELGEHERQCQEVVARRRGARVEAQVISQPQQKTSATEGDAQYDQVLSIDVSDDAEPLSLPINRGDDPRLAAKRFIDEHQLPTSYEDQIVAFIEQVGPK